MMDGKEDAMSTATLSVPMLKHGDRLSRDEFERRYEAMSDVKAELLDGVVYIMSSPVSIDHGDPDRDLMCWLAMYKACTPGTASGANTTTRMTDKSEPQPDSNLRILEECGGNAVIDDDRYISGSPELLGEISRSSADYDRRVKLPIYRDAGVREFILWRIDDQEIDWRILRNGQYEQVPASDDGIIRSETFPGLWLDVAAMIRGDLASVLNVLRRGIESPEHAEFTAELQHRKQTRS
jgi:Uma2 family endonuclease